MGRCSRARLGGQATGWVSLALWLLLPAGPVLSEEANQDLEEEESLLEDADFPDLVGVRDTSEIMDEFALLEEASGIDEVQSASKHRQSIFWSPSAVTIFTREDLRTAPVQTLPDILRRVPGFDIYEVKPTFPLVGARALTEISNNLVLLLVDGRETLIELAGSPIWSGLTFSNEEIERIEVIRGPGSALYGANAFAAVVNITTVSDQRGRRLDAFLTGGERGAQRWYGRVRDSWRLGDGDLLLSAAAIYQGQNFPSARGFGSDGLMLHGYLRYHLPQKMELSLQAGGSGIAGTLVQFAGEARTEDVSTTWVMAKAEFLLGPDMRLKAQAYFNRFATDLEFPTGFYAYNMWIFDVPRQYAVNDSVDSQLQFDWRLLDELLLIAGANLRHTWLSEDEGFVLETRDETRGAAFVHLEWRFQELLQLTGGLRFDVNSVTEPALSPRLVAVLRPSPQQSIRLGYGSSFRKPTWMEHGVHFAIQDFNPAVPGIVEKMAESFGNPDIGNEEVHSFEAGWRAHLLGGQLRLATDLFYNLYRNTIHFFVHLPQTSLGLPDIHNSIMTNQNTGTEANALGGEFEVAWHPDPQWKLWANLGLRYVTEKESGDRLETEPVLRANLGARYLPTYGLRVDLSLHYVSEYDAPMVTPAGLLEGAQMMTLGNTILMMAQLGYALEIGSGRTVELGVSLRHPLGPNFRDFPGGPHPPGVIARIPGESMGELIMRSVAFFLRASL